ncbi:MAG: hypothetical protein LC768_07655 [Acidobacteria bacterium]|nr:hypothetical protein [Acidobacteriota bacterium]MCA1638196.1 hypothetical protein [Acidobacteriota bacterium]
MVTLIKDLIPIADAAVDAVKRAGFEHRSPTPLVDDFWVTSLTPSSSEVMFRELSNSQSSDSTSRRIFTVQPCVRFADLAPWSDGVHLLYFHMLTCFVINCEDPLDDVKWFSDVLRTLGAPVKDSYFTYFSGNSHLVPKPQLTGFDGAFLERVGVSRERCVPCSGLANYQVNLHRDETGNKYEVWGPKIEIMSNLGSGIEYGTLIYGRGIVPHQKEPFAPTLSLVVGLERLAQVKNGYESFWEMPSMNRFRELAIRHFFGNRPSKPLIADVEHSLELIMTLLCIARDVPDLAPGERGVRNQLHRIVRTTSRKLAHIGLKVCDVLKISQEGLAGVHFHPDVVKRVATWLGD